ncbi:hypothetical protein JOM56_014831 [Amanita muscaria]
MLVRKAEMDSYWVNLITTLWLVAALPGASATQICYNTFGTQLCPSRAHIGIGVAFLLLLVLIIVGVIYWQRRRASRERDAIATVEANQLDGPLPTPFESGFVQVQGPPVSCPAPAYHTYGPRTAPVPTSAYSIGFTPIRSAYIPKRQQSDSYSSEIQYSATLEDVLLAPPPPPAATRKFP